MRLNNINTRARIGTVAALIALCAILFGATSALALNPERHYEMVSPVFKGGYGILDIRAVAEEGEKVAFYSFGAFAGAPSGFSGLDYLAHRGASGWSTVPLMPPASLVAEGFTVDVTPSLNLELALGKPGPNSQSSVLEEQFLLHQTESLDTSSNWELAGTLAPVTQDTVGVNEEAASSSFCSVLIGDAYPLVPEAIGLPVGLHELYRFNRGCEEEQKSLALVGLNNKGQLMNRTCYTGLGNEYYAVGPPSTFNAVSRDGGEVFFTTCTKQGKETNGPEDHHQLFVRLGGSRTIEVSRPVGGCVANAVPGEVPCEGAAERLSADFAGASEDGSKVYFTTSASLVEGDKDTSNDLYVASIGCSEAKPSCSVAEREVTSLTQVSHDPTLGQAANVQGVVRVAPDGSRVYFVANGDLLNHTQQDTLENSGRSVPRVGAENLYVYDSDTAGTTFIGDLCSGRELSGSVEDIRCPSQTGTDETLWNNYHGDVQTAGADGRFLVFTTYAQLLPGDTNKAQDVYRYDAERGLLERVSGGEDGYDADGNHEALGENGQALGAKIAEGHLGGLTYEQHELNNRAISEDGTRIVFTSAEPLSPLASNGLENVYEWHKAPGSEGVVSLISGGTAEQPVSDVVISPLGNDIYFLTSQGLLPQDTDGAPDIYDARLGADFPAVPAPAQPCAGDACQGPLTNPAPLLVPGSVSQAPGGNLVSPVPALTVKSKPKSKSVKCSKGHVKAKQRCVKSKSRKQAKKSNRRGSK